VSGSSPRRGRGNCILPSTASEGHICDNLRTISKARNIRARAAEYHEKCREFNGGDDAEELLQETRQVVSSHVDVQRQDVPALASFRTRHVEQLIESKAARALTPAGLFLNP
jgi:hypothetical protein